MGHAAAILSTGRQWARPRVVARLSDLELQPSRKGGWKLFHVDKVHEIDILKEGFQEPRLGCMRNDPTMTKAFCDL